ncbi:MAG TPA: methylmalonyl-CoA epimerase [Thermomicrobiales bacterium]|nr:methylmalonyl-CoA epimerase [Thermomicrobiales bacterium]
MSPESVLGELRLHHVGIVVADLDAAIARYEALGFRKGERHDIPEQHIVAVTFRAGSGWVELIQPTALEGPIARYMAKRGEGTHHVAYAVDNIVAAMNRLRDAGIRLIDETPRSGAHGWKIGFIHPEACHGVLTELVQE